MDFILDILAAVGSIVVIVHFYFYMRDRRPRLDVRLRLNSAQVRPMSGVSHQNPVQMSFDLSLRAYNDSFKVDKIEWFERSTAGSKIEPVRLNQRATKSTHQNRIAWARESRPRNRTILESDLWHTEIRQWFKDDRRSRPHSVGVIVKGGGKEHGRAEIVIGEKWDEAISST